MMPSPYGSQAGATQHPPSSGLRVVSSYTDSASPSHYNASSPAFPGGSTTGPPPPAPPPPPPPPPPLPESHRRLGTESHITPPPFNGYHYQQQHPVLAGYPTSSGVFPGGNYLSTQHSVASSVHPDPLGRTSGSLLPPSAISFPSGQSVAASQGGFIDTIMGGNTPGDSGILPEQIRSIPEGFVNTPGLNGAASPFSVGHRRVPDVAPIIFYTDLDFPYDNRTSPIRMIDASRDVNRSHDTSTTYRISFDQDPAGPPISQCHFGTDLSQTVELCFENIDPHNIYQHRYILLCRHGTGKFYGLEICPSKSRTIRSFPLLLAIKDPGTHQTVSYVANPLLRGSLNGEPGNMKSNYDWYVSTSGWLGGGVVSSYPTALCFNDNFHRLTKKSGSQVRGLGLNEVLLAEDRVTDDTKNPPFCPPSIREYILRQFITLGIPDFPRMDCFSTGRPGRYQLPVDYPILDPVLIKVNPSSSSPPPAPVVPGPWRAYHTTPIAPSPVANVSDPVPIGGISHPFTSQCSVVSAGVSMNENDNSVNESRSSGTGTPTVYSIAKLESEDRQRQSTIKRIQDTKSLKLPKVGADQFLQWKDNLQDELRGSPWHPHGTFILDYTATDVNDPAMARTSNDLTYIMSVCAKMQDKQTYRQLIGGGGQELLRSGLGIELFHHAVLLYSPTGIRATWDGEDAWSKLQHNQSELIDSLSVRIDECALQLNRTSGSLLPYNEFSCKLKLAKSVFCGPYCDAFKDVSNKMCIVQDPEWDISLSELTYTILTNKLSSHLRRSPYFTANGLSKGKGRSSSAISANNATMWDRYGKMDLHPNETLGGLRRFWAKAGSDFGTQGGSMSFVSIQVSFVVGLPSSTTARSLGHLHGIQRYKSC